MPCLSFFFSFSLCVRAQVEGVIADYDLTLGNLIGVLNDFFQRLGMTGEIFVARSSSMVKCSCGVCSFDRHRQA
jgi:hypothetical protein